jgi:hypothetical protein
LGKRDHGSGPFTLFACECVNGVCCLSQQLICCWQCVASRHSPVQLCSQHLCRASRPVSATETMAVLGLTPCLHVQVWQHLLVCLDAGMCLAGKCCRAADTATPVPSLAFTPRMGVHGCCSWMTVAAVGLGTCSWMGFMDDSCSSGPQVPA